MSDSELEAGILCASDLKADAQVIHIEKVWQCKHRSLSEELKYTCLSFSLFHLLRRRFFGFECGESSFQPKTHDFVFKGLLLLKNEDGVISYNQAFKVIEVELAFMYDFFFTKYAAVYYGSWHRTFMPVASACLVPVIAYLTVSRVLKIPSGMERGIVLDTTRADVVITVAILVCIALLEVLQVLYYWTTIWGRVSLACQYVREQAQNKQRGCCMRFKEILAKIGVSMSNERYFEGKLGQYSLLEGSVSWYHNLPKHYFVNTIVEKVMASTDPMIYHPYNYHPWREVRKHIRVTEEVKEAVVQSLERTDGKLTNGASSLVLNRAPHLLWACGHSESIAGCTQKKENQAMQLRLPMASHPPTGPKQAAAIGHRCQAQTTEEQLRLPITNQRLAPSGSRPQQRLGLRRRRAHSVSSLLSHVSNAAASTSQCKTRLHAPTTTKIQMQRLQGGDDANGAIVARSERTGLSPLDDSARGENDTLNRKSGAQPASPSP